jgi:hypothetical protein
MTEPTDSKKLKTHMYTSVSSTSTVSVVCYRHRHCMNGCYRCRNCMNEFSASLFNSGITTPMILTVNLTWKWLMILIMSMDFVVAIVAAAADDDDCVYFQLDASSNGHGRLQEGRAPQAHAKVLAWGSPLHRQTDLHCYAKVYCSP